MEIKWHQEERKIKDLIPASYNPRKLTEKQAEDLKASLGKFGLAEPIVINTNNTVIGGHQRLKTLADLYGTDYLVAVNVPDRELILEEEKELNIRLNRNVGEWDWDVLNKEFEVGALMDWGFQSFEFGMSKPNLDFVAENDKEEELPEYEGNDLEASHVRMVQLFLNSDTQPQFLEYVESLKEKYAIDNLTDAVFKAVEESYNDYQKSKESI